MAGFQKIYTSENEYLYDLGKTTGYFDEEYYNLAKESGSDYQYLQMMASLKQTGVSNTFDPVLYGKLSGEERFNYLATENFMDKSSEDYTKSSQYFKQREKQIQNEEIYASLSGFEKTMNSIGGWLGNAFLQVGGIVEGLIDAAIFSGSFLAQSTGIPALIGKADELAAGTKELIGKDTIGYNAAQASMNDWINKYTFIDKNVVTQAINDVTTGIVRMAPMLIPGVGQAGAILYYASMMGNTAEQAITANPDINYGNLLLYTGGSVGLEALTEWASGKLFGDDLISSLMKGQKYAPTGTIVKTIAKNFGTEALEEAVAEIFGSLMYAGLVTGDVNDIASIGDIFYAAIIGGLTGAVMSGGQIATTKRMVVTQDGQLKYRSDLTAEELKTAKKLKLSESWGLQSLIQQSQKALSTPDNMTQLMAETGKSISQLQTENANEYEKAVAKDTETKTQQAKAILDLANLMSTIGVEQFTKSAELLKNNANLATKYVNNFLNHTDVANKKASEVFSANYPGKSFTPTVIPSKPNQALAEALRQAFPQLKVVFGTFGSEDGLPVRAINKGETYLFLDENMVSQKGYQQVLHETIRYQLADQLMQEINILDNVEANRIVKLVTDLDVDYDKLTKEQKLSIAQILCFDPVNSRRLFKGSDKTHAKIFNYITDQSEYVKKFGRQTEANKMRYHDLLEIRNMYIKNIAETIFNNEDVQTAKKQYNLTDEETKTKIIDKTENTILNDTIAIMRQNLDKNVIARQEAIEDLLQNRVETNKSVPFDWSNLYNEEYYNENWVAQIKQQQQTQDFQEALRAHLLASHKVDFSIIEHSTLVDAIQNNVTIDELNKLAEMLFTKEYLDTNPDLQVSVADALYTMVQTEDTDADSVVAKDNQIQGTGKLKFLKVKVDEKINTYNEQQSRELSESAREQVGNVVTKSTTIANKVTINEIDESSYNDRQREMVVYARKEYLVNLHFYEGSAILDGYDKSVDYGLNGFIYGEDDVYIRYDDTLNESDVEKILLHEGTHRLIAARRAEYEILRDKIISLWKTDTTWDAFKAEYSSDDMYGKIYDNESDIEEEIIVDLCCGRIATREYVNGFAVIEAIFDFYNEVSLTMVAKEKGMFPNNKKLLRQHETRDSIPSHIMTNETSTWTQERLDALIKRNTSPSNPKIVYAYAAYINPHDFVAVTTNNARERSTLRRQMRDYAQEGVALEDMKTNTETPFLHIDPITMEILGHEGRHRMWSMYEAGITEAPVVLFVDDSDVASIQFSNNTDVSNKIYKNVSFKGQADYFGTRRNDSKTFVVFRDMIPLNESNRKSLEKTFVTGWSSGGPKFKFAKDLKPQKSAIRENAKTQKIKTSDLLANKEAKNKHNELTELVSDEKLTAYQGEHDQQTIITTSRDIYQDPENQTFFENLTSNDYQAIRRLLLLDQTMESDARMALLDVYAYEHRNTQFKDIKDFITYTYQRMVSGGMRYGGLSNSLYGSHAVSSLVSEIETDTGNDIEIPVNIVENALSKLGIEGQNVQEYQTYLRKQVTDLEKQLKQTKDPYDKHVLRDQINELQHLLDTIEDEDFSGVLDAVINMLNNKETDVAKNQEAISEIHQRLIAYVLQHSKMGPNNKIQMSKNKSVLSPEAKEKLITGLMAINSFRYMCMLSSPTTMARNAVSNTAISVQAIAEDAVAGKFEKTGLLATESQVNYVGEYNEDFSKYIDKTYGARIDADTEGDKYTTTNIEKLRNQYAQEKDPLKRNKITAKIKELEQKGLSDKPWTKRRTLRNLKNMFAGAKTRILLDCESWLIAKYRKSTPAKNMTQSLLIERITNAEIKNLYKDAISNSNTSLKSTIMLGEKLKIDLCDKNSENSIYKRALYRSNKLLFKTDNWLSNTMRNLRKSHPVAAELLTWFQPFMKVAFNTTLYAIDRSPIGIAKGVIKTLQTRTAYISDMKRLITDYYRQQYREINKGVKDWSFDESKFNEWFKQSAKTSVRNAIISIKHADIKQVYDTMVNEGLIPRQALGSDNPYMRAEAFEALGHGIVGTSLMTLGLILAAVTGAFDYDDDDDYLGPVVRIGDLKIALDDLTPFTTMFTVGAMLGSNNIDNSMEAAFKVFVDQTMFSVIDSAIVYSDDLGDFFGNQIINTVQQFIPAITKGLSKSIYNAKPDKSGNWFEKLIKTTGSNLITFGWAVPRKINPYTGEKLSYYESGRFEGFVNWIFPIQFRIDNKSTAEKEAIRLGAETTGLSGKFNINTVDYVVKDKEKYAKYRADYIESQFNEILNGKQEVTVEDDNGKRITTTYDKLNDKQKKNVINRLYTDATAVTKIKWWTDQGNKYVVTNRDQYNEYRKMFSNIIYKKTWTKSKFVES